MCLDKRKVAHPFYSSTKWANVRRAYLSSVHHICEECGRPAEQVHHKEPLMEEDYFVNFEKCYGFANLIALCRSCHNRKPGHFLAHLNKQRIADGYRVNMVTGEIELSPPYSPINSHEKKPSGMRYEKLDEEG